MSDLLPGLSIFQDAMARAGRSHEDLTKALDTPPHTVSQVRREQLHADAVKRRRKRKKGGPK